MKTLQVENIISGMPPVLGEDDVIALDIEMANLKDGQLHRPYGNLLSLAGCFDGKTAYIIFGEDEVQEFLNRVDKATWLFHNSTFDLAHLRRWAKIPERKAMRDTMLIEKLLWSNYYDDFALADLVRRYLKCYMDKSIRKEFANMTEAMTSEQIRYAALDVVGTWLVDKEQQKIVTPTDMKIWNSMYNPHVWAVLEMEGFTLDVDAWKTLVEKNQAISDEIEKELGQLYGHTQKKFTGRGKNRVEVEGFTPFNPASPAQVLALFRSQGIDTVSTGDKEVSKFSKEFPIVRKILDYRVASKKVSTYGLSFLEFVEEDGRVHTSMNIALAISGRDSSKAPNLQNIPSDPEYRKCYVAGKGKKLVVYDYSGQEANIFAYLTQDPKLIEIIISGKKLYIEVARIAFNEVVEKGSDRYKNIKGLVLGLMYGLSPYGYAIQEDMLVEDAQVMFDAFFVAFPVTADWVRTQQSHNPGTVRSILGRTIHLHPYARQWTTHILNIPMQSSAADMIKLALREFRKTPFYKEYHPKDGVNIIVQVHDEIIVECDDWVAPECAEVLAKCMNEVAEMIHKGIPSRVSGGICDNWSEKEG